MKHLLALLIALSVSGCAMISPVVTDDEALVGRFEDVQHSSLLLDLRADHHCSAWIVNASVFPGRLPTSGTWSVKSGELSIQWPDSRESFKVVREAGAVYLRSESISYRKSTSAVPQQPTPAVVR